jgi:hypothetical protein
MSRRLLSPARLALVVLGIAILTPGPGRTDPKPTFVDPMLRRLMRASELAQAQHGRPEAIPRGELDFYARQVAIDPDADPPVVRVRLTLDGYTRQEIERLGISTYGRLDGFATAFVPIPRLSEIAALPGVTAMHAVRIPHMELDVSRPEVLSTQAATTYRATGRGVILGSVDTGVDITQPDMRHADGTTRIKYFWSQDDTCVGVPPAAPFNYGCLYTEAQINAALTGGPSITTPDAEGHGTHTIGVAAGNGAATGHGYPAGRYVGMAPEANIIVVKALPEPGRTTACNTCYGIGDGLDFIDLKAGELGEPYVVNLSLGSQYGGHDGSDPDEQTIDALIGAGIPGKAVTKSAGNDRGHFIHLSGTVTAGATNTHSINIPSYTPLTGAINDAVAWSIWYANGDNVTVSIATPASGCNGTNNVTLTSTTGQGAKTLDSGRGFMIIDDTASPAVNGARFFDMEIDDQGLRAPCPGLWNVKVKGNTIAGGGHYDAWIWFSSFGASQLEGLWTTGDDAKTLTIPGTSFDVTAVGGYMTKYSWLSVDGNNYSFKGTALTDVGKIAWFSSPGPTRDNRQKPEVTAPGTAIVSSLSANVDASLAGGNQPNIVEDGVHWALPGTSFSSPHVAGIYAQMLSLNRNLDAIQLRSLATSTARVDNNVSLPVPNADWGYGKISALAMADRVVKAIPDVTMAQTGQLAWSAIPLATTYNVYRGDLALKSSTYYGSCLVTGLPTPTYTDPTAPVTGGGIFYLVTGVKDGIEGMLGFRSDGTPRPNNSPCP